MRVGRNPLTNNKQVSRLPSLVIAVIVHLPDLKDPYHAERLEVVATSLTAARQNAGMNAPILIWDNGSCKQLKKWYSKFEPDYLIESPNIGKTTARMLIGRMWPEDTLIAVSDDDIFYYPNWLLKQYKLYHHFPGVSCVTGYPVRTSFRWGNKNTIMWAKRNAKITHGRFIPDQWEQDFCDSIGRDYERHKAGTMGDQETIVEYNGVKAFTTSHHCQFLSSAKLLTKTPVFDGHAMADEKPFDERMDALGLRLSTVERMTRHIGNVLDDNLRKEAEALGVYSNGK